MSEELMEQTGQEVQRPLAVIEGEILFYKAQAGGAMLEIGRRLAEAKKQVPHGEWGAWLEEKVQFSGRSAQRFMKLAEEYGTESDTVTLLGTRKALALLTLEPDEREEILAENHLVGGEEKSAGDMSAEEFEELIRAKKEAKKLQAEVERLEDQGKVMEAKLTSAEVELGQARRKAEKAQADADQAETARRKMAQDMVQQKKLLDGRDQEAKEARERAEDLAKQLQALRSKPVDVAVREPSAEEIEAKAAPAVAKAREESREEIEALRKKLAAADPCTAAFKVRFDAWQEGFSRMMEALEQVAAADRGKADKLHRAVAAALEAMVKKV